MVDPCDICPDTVTLPSCAQVIRVTVLEGRGIPGPAGKSFAPDMALPAGSTLPVDGNYPGRSALMDGYLYIWDGTQWGNGGLIRGPSGGTVQSWDFIGDGVKTTFLLSPEPTSQDKTSYFVERTDQNGQFPVLLPLSAFDIVETAPRVWSVRFPGAAAAGAKINVRNFGVVTAGTAAQWVTVAGTQDVTGDKTFKGEVTLTKGTVAAGNVLVCDATGKASWQAFTAPPSSGAGGSAALPAATGAGQTLISTGVGATYVATAELSFGNY